MKLRHLIPLLLVGLIGFAGNFGEFPVTAQDDPPPIPTLKIGDTLTSGLEYTPGILVDAAPGEMFTLVFSNLSQFFATRGWDAADVEVEPLLYKVTPTTAYHVYQFETPGPYLISVIGGGAYTLTVLAGDALSVDRGAVEIGQLVEGEAVLTELDIYRLEVAADTVLTLRLEAPVRSWAWLPQHESEERAVLQQTEVYNVVYHLAEAGTVEIAVKVDAGPYTLHILAGDTLTTPMGQLAFDTPVADSITLGTLDVYDIEAEMGDVVTVMIDSAAGFAVANTIRGDNLSFIRTVDDFLTETGYGMVYEMGDYRIDAETGAYENNEAAPYRIFVQGEGEYTITLLRGRPLGDAQLIALNETVEASQTLSTKAVYVLDAPEGTVVSLQTTVAAGESLVSPFMTTAADNFMDSEVRVGDDATGTVTAVYTLVGKGPYWIDFQGAGDFSFTVTEGDLIHQPQGDVLLDEIISGTATADDYFLYDLPQVENGQTVVVYVTGMDGVGLFDGERDLLRTAYFGFLGHRVDYAARTIRSIYVIESDGPYQLQADLAGGEYTLQIVTVGPEAFPAGQPLALNTPLSTETGDALLIPYLVEAEVGHITVTVETDPNVFSATYLGWNIVGPNGVRAQWNTATSVFTDEMATVEFELTAAGTYRLILEYIEGPYTITVTQGE